MDTIKIYRGLPPRKLLDFLNRVFMTEKGRVGNEQKSFPHVFNGARCNFFVVLENADSIAGNVTVREISYKDFKLGMVGFVSTAKEKRGQGIATKLLLKAEKLMRRRNLQAGLLWTSKHELYKNIGWRKINLYPHYLIKLDSKKRNLLTVKETKDARECFKLYKRFHGFPYRTLLCFRELFHISHHIHFGKIKKYLLADNKKNVGYFFAGENHRVIEFVSQPERIRDSLCTLKEFFYVKDFPCPLFEAPKMPFQKIQDTLSMAKILSRSMTAAKLQKTHLFVLDKI